MKFSENGNTQALKVLLDNGAELNRKNNKGKTALMYAVENGHTKAVKLLFQYRADFGFTASKISLDEETSGEETLDEETLDKEISEFWPEI